METHTKNKGHGWRRDTLAPELKRMVRRRLAEKAAGDESWWDNVWIAEDAAKLDPEIIQLEQSYQYVEQSREQKGLNYVGD